ncbi:SusC/RagA family TonB-linked outer membrane protein [Pontibacter harenae]|uniref:SusC/RagA family TonB-linked outer membrane protein n=1 Tax=Pontibacter harenae TaxID=2894083 RepID=UPI001E5BF0E1|nr:TonB-dependent receptor [Pontibacter harenae]MCC9168695.1 TonB-dependent receptor [Pontibacter harenae]
MKHILFRKMKQLMFVPLVLFAIISVAAQGTVVTGKVTDETGVGLPGVTVLLKGTNTAAPTDIDGNFSLNVPSLDGTLVFSFLGYQQQEVPLNGRASVDVNLKTDAKALDEVVVVGYGTQKKATVTGSISEVDGEALNRSPQPNVSNALSGRVSGVIINNRGGEPGYDGAEIRVRGLATTGNNEVLIVVDGVPGQIGGLDRLDPNDIESITVLKDASAAVYGNRAANGVILVTTKRGTTGKPTISYSFNQGFSSPTRLPEFADAATYATILNEIDYYNNPAGGLNQRYTEQELELFRNGSDPINYPNTNWLTEVLNPVAPQNRQSLSVNGGTENIRYYASLGTVYQDGLYKNGATEYKQYNFRTNLDAYITDDFSVGLSISGRQENRQYPQFGAGGIFWNTYRAYPFIPARYPNGMPSAGVEGGINPVMIVTDAAGLNKNQRLIFNGILRAKYELPFLEGLSVDGFYSVDKGQNFSKSFTKPYLVYSYEGNDTYRPVTVGEPNASLFQAQENTTLITSNIKLNFTRQFGDHGISAFVGYEQSENNLEHFEAGRRNFPTPLTPELSQGGTGENDRSNAGWSWVFTRRSYLGRATYNFKEKYLAELQLRADGSANFPRNSRWGYFPGVSVGWRISEELWFRNSVPFFSDLKLRASYGALGNDNVGSNQFINNYAFDNRSVIGGVVHPGINLIKLANPNITWEVAQKTDIGLNGVLFKDLSFEFIYFRQKRKDILASRNASVPNVTGIVNPYGSDPLVPSENIGRVDNNGIEATLGYNKSAGDFKYNISGNITYATNEIVFIDEASEILDYQRQTGRPMNTYLRYRAIGIFRTQDDLDNYPHPPGAKLGDLIYEDYNRDGEITADDMVRTELGNIPEIVYGVNLGAEYKNFDLSVLFQGQGKVRQYVLPDVGISGNYFSTWADNRWSPTNPDGSYPRVDTRTGSSVSGGLFPSDFWLYNTAFLRLKNIELGYNLPTQLLSKIKIGNVRVYANAFNLLTFSKVKDFDPETSSGNAQFYPQQRIVNLGVNVRF